MTVELETEIRDKIVLSGDTLIVSSFHNVLQISLIKCFLKQTYLL